MTASPIHTHRADDLATGSRVMLKDLRVLEITSVKYGVGMVTLGYQELASKTYNQTMTVNMNQQVKVLCEGGDSCSIGKALADLI